MGLFRVELDTGSETADTGPLMETAGDPRWCLCSSSEHRPAYFVEALGLAPIVAEFRRRSRPGWRILIVPVDAACRAQ